MQDPKSTMFDTDVASLYERMIPVVYESLLQDGDVAIDIGANQGFHTFPMADSVSPSGAVFAFEPIPIHYHQLVDKVQSNPKYTKVVRMAPFAISNKEERVSFTVNLDNTAFCSGLHKNQNVKYGQTKTIGVTTRTLDSLNFGTKRVRFIKVDVDGAELQVLDGAMSTLKSHRPVVVFECGDFCSDSYGYKSSDIFRLLNLLGYRVYTITGSLLATEEAFAECTKLQAVWNFIALAAESADSWIVSRLKSIAGAQEDTQARSDGCFLSLETERAKFSIADVYDFVDVDVVI